MIIQDIQAYFILRQMISEEGQKGQHVGSLYNNFIVHTTLRLLFRLPIGSHFYFQLVYLKYFCPIQYHLIKNTR